MGESNPDGSPLEPTRRTVLQLLGTGTGLAALGSTPALGAEQSDNDGKSYQLPELPYAYDALEPGIAAAIMRLHHDEHHQGYVDGANAALKELEKMRTAGEFDGIKPVKRDLSFNLSGHVLHSLFWTNMAPDGGGKPTGTLAKAVTNDFGSLENLKKEFIAAGGAVEGSGWGMLVYDHLADQLLVTQAEDHNDLAVQGATPLLVCDVWEHAYYLQYTNDRTGYLNAFWHLVNWEEVTKRYKTAQKLTMNR